jgi:hypothetical protein
MQQIINQTNTILRFLTGKTNKALKKLAVTQYVLAIEEAGQPATPPPTTDYFEKGIATNKPLTDWDIAFMQEQNRYYRYTAVVRRRTFCAG